MLTSSLLPIGRKEEAIVHTCMSVLTHTLWQLNRDIHRRRACYYDHSNTLEHLKYNRRHDKIDEVIALQCHGTTLINCEEENDGSSDEVRWAKLHTTSVCTWEWICLGVLRLIIDYSLYFSIQQLLQQQTLPTAWRETWERMKRCGASNCHEWAVLVDTTTEEWRINCTQDYGDTVKHEPYSTNLIDLDLQLYFFCIGKYLS